MANDPLTSLVQHWVNAWNELDQEFTCVPALPRNVTEKFRIERSKDLRQVIVKHIHLTKVVKQIEFPSFRGDAVNYDLPDNISGMDVAFLQIAVETTLEVY